MSAFHKSQQAPKDEYCLYHLYIEGVGDIQYGLHIHYPYTITFRQIIDTALTDILKLNHHSIEPAKIQSYHRLARAFPRAYLTGHHSTYAQLYLKIGRKMIDTENENIEVKVKNLLSYDKSTLSLNDTYVNNHMKKNECLFIISLDTYFPLSTSTTTVSVSPKIYSSNIENTNPNTNNSNKNKSKIVSKISKKSKKKKPKPKPKKKKPKKKKKSKKRTRKKRHNYSSDDVLDNNSEYTFSDDDYETESEEDYLESDEEFFPPRKRIKVNLLTVPNKLSRKYPKSMIRRAGNGRGHMISRHRQFSNVPRISMDIRQRKQRLRRIEQKPNHLVILLDVSRSMNSNLMYQFYEDEQGISRYEMAWKRIKSYVQKQWRLPEQQQTLISMATFGSGLDIHANTLKYNTANVAKLMRLLMELKKKIAGVLDEFETETALYDSLLELLTSFKENKMKHYKNTRILMFTDGENRASEGKLDEIKIALKHTRITVDAIQCSRSERDVAGLRKVCVEYSNNGRYWNPLTMDDWDAVFQSVDFNYPYRRNYVWDLTK